MIDQNGVTDRRGPVAIAVLDHFPLKEILDRVMVVSEAELAPHRSEIGLLERRTKSVDVLDISVDGFDRRLDQEDRVVALRRIEGRIGPVLRLEVGNEPLVCGLSISGAQNWVIDVPNTPSMFACWKRGRLIESIVNTVYSGIWP